MKCNLLMIAAKLPAADMIAWKTEERMERKRVRIEIWEDGFPAEELLHRERCILILTVREWRYLSDCEKKKMAECALVFLGKEEDKVLLPKESGNWILLREETASPRERKAQIEEVFWYYENLEERLSAIAEKGAPVEDVMDMLAETLENPVYLVDSYMNIVAHSRDKKGGPFEVWLKKNDCPLQEKEVFAAEREMNLLDWLSQSHESKLVCAQVDSYPFLFRNIFLENEKICIVGCLGCYREIREPETAVMEYAVERLEGFFFGWYQKNRGFEKEEEAALYRLFMGAPVESRFLSQIEERHRRRNEESVLVRMCLPQDVKNGAEKMIRGALCEMWGETASVVLLGEDTLTWISKKNWEETDRERFQRFLEKYGIRAAIGFPFKHLTQIRAQAGLLETLLHVLEKKEKPAGIYECKDYLWDIIKQMLGQENREYLCLPIIQELRERDLRLGEEWVHSLEVFLKQEGSYVAAAKDLHIHRNTLVYRIEKMEKNGVSLATPEDRFLALLSCLLSEE